MLGQRVLVVLGLAIGWASSGWATVDVTGHISTGPVLGDISQLPSTARIVLDNGQYATPIQSDGRFTLHSVPDGTYLLEVWDARYEFSKTKIVVKQNTVQASVTDHGAEWLSQGAPLVYPLTLTPHTERAYFMKREGFNIIGMFTNPYMLMMGFSVIMLVVVSKMKNLDPEVYQEMQQSQNNIQNSMDMPDISQKLANMFAPPTQ